eukprot:CAMPEP_0172380344 /NCGR_PEP_ID=MMETSP1060-20121228/70389_1 /TAXON_ID=37318 /ORGANISM="Pseudo-nitzschia pungens, Strain cf. cingulata" /LENGTH=1087 /DNA_ID=CAMNT_0013108097 /DNA_START=268 /DNA_END=3533 /DNA_ORIENTATION=-
MAMRTEQPSHSVARYLQKFQRKHPGEMMRLRALSSRSSAEVDEPLTQEQQQALQDALEDYRKEQADSLGQTPTRVLSNNVISRICSAVPPPSTKDELLQVRGLGEKKINDYGDGILGVLSIYRNGTKRINGAAAPSEPKLIDEKTLEKATPSLSPKAGVVSSTPSYLVDNEETTLQRRQQQHGKLHVALNKYRMEQAESLGKHPAQLLCNNLVDRICASEPLPTTKEELLQIKGFGSKKLEHFGDGILDVLSSYDKTRNKPDHIVPITTERVQQDPFTEGSFFFDKTRNKPDHIVPITTERVQQDPFTEGSFFLMEAGAAYYHIAPHSAPVNAPATNGFAAPVSANDKTDEIDSSASLSLDSFAAPAPCSAPIDERVGPASSTLDGDFPGGVKADFSKDDSFSPDSFVAPAPYSAPPDESVAVPNPSRSTLDDDYSFPTGQANQFEQDSYVAPAPHSAPLDECEAPAPYSNNAAEFSLDSFVSPAPYSFNDDVDGYDEWDDYAISEESFGDAAAASSSKTEETEPKPSMSKVLLREELKDYRLRQKDEAKPAYTVFTNAALEGIYRELPMTESELLDVKGIGPKKVELYGDDILAMVSKYAGVKGESDEEDLPSIVPEKVDPKSLTIEQRKAADWIFGNTNEEDGDVWQDQTPRNVFVTGSAGTGKSHLLKYVVETLKSRGMYESGGTRVAVCAPTGVAALIVGGSTLHSFFGIGLGTGTPASILKKVRDNFSAEERIDETDVLVIDECSMMSSKLMETLDMVSRKIRKGGLYRDVPFGGMQVIAFGDFFQLPPVFQNDGTVDRTWRPFCFGSSVWEELGLSENVVELEEVQRQEDEDFVELLNKVRIGKVDETDIRGLNERCLVGPENPLPTDGILPTKIYVLNKDVDSENVHRLKELKGKEIVCKASDTWKESMPFGTPTATKTKMKESLDLEMPEEVKLKVGAQVMLTRNKDLKRNLVNGSRGVVERLVQVPEGSPIPTVRFDTGLVTKIMPVESERFNPDGGPGCLVRRQIPLKLAWAITIHKSQGSTLTRASLDITSAFEYGQVYVALSRVKSLEGLWLERPAELRHIKVSPQVVDFFGGTE